MKGGLFLTLTPGRGGGGGPRNGAPLYLLHVVHFVKKGSGEASSLDDPVLASDFSRSLLDSAVVFSNMSVSYH